MLSSQVGAADAEGAHESDGTTHDGGVSSQGGGSGSTRPPQAASGSERARARRPGLLEEEGSKRFMKG